MCLSHDVGVIQWITSCYKKVYMTTSVSAMRFLLQIFFILKAIKSIFKESYDKKILHSWSFHMKFMKLAEGSFHKFYMK